MSAEQLKAAGVGEELVRLSVGLEAARTSSTISPRRCAPRRGLSEHGDDPTSSAHSRESGNRSGNPRHKRWVPAFAGTSGMSLRVCHALMVDGSETYVATGGRAFDPGQPAVVFLHGAGLDHTVWALLARWFAHHGCGVLAPDLPGHGRSGGAPLAPSPPWRTGPRR